MFDYKETVFCIFPGLVFTFRVNRHHCERCSSLHLCRSTRVSPSTRSTWTCCRDTTPAWGMTPTSQCHQVNIWLSGANLELVWNWSELKVIIIDCWEIEQRREKKRNNVHLGSFQLSRTMTNYRNLFCLDSVGLKLKELTNIQPRL